MTYLKQLSLLREKSLKVFRQALTTEGTEFEAMVQVRTALPLPAISPSHTLAESSLFALPTCAHGLAPF